jgi:RHS repeat-associated protein
LAPNEFGESGNADPTALVYDASGNLLTRTPKTAPGQTLKWDDDYHLAEVDITGANPSATKYLYDADGHQLIRRDPGKTTLFAGDTEITIDTSVVPPVAMGAVRTYTHGGTPIAVHSSLPGGGTSYLFNDPHGTSTLAMDIANQQLSRKQQKPYGEDRAAVSQLAWPDITHGYLGKSKDGATGYTNLGARKYDPPLGSFISADPLLETSDPNQLGGYTYAGDNPITLSDPTGMSPRLEQYQSTACPDECQAMATAGAGVSMSNNADGSVNVGGVRVEAGRTRDDTKYTKTVNEYWNSNIAAGQPDPTSRLLVAMAAACEDKHSVCSAAFASETLTATALRAQYNKGCRGECLAEYEKTVATADLLMAGALLHDAEVGNTKAVSSASAMTGEEQLLGLAKGGCIGNSFSADTKVVMADGTTKPIKEVKKGDTVRTTDPLTGEDEMRVVTATHINRDHNLADLIITDAHGHRTTIHTTESHPFWDDTRQSWVTAAHLHDGDRLRTSGGATHRVVAVVPMLGSQNMYNLTVADDHTYYVLAGNTPVLVHNTGPLCGVHGGDSGSPAGAGIVEGPAPAKAFDMLNKVKERTGGIGKVPGYEGNGSWGNKSGQLPGGAYREWDVNATADLPTCSECGRPIRGGERLLTPKSGSGPSYYTPDHYATFYYVGEYP